jgi:hypothetical protein
MRASIRNLIDLICRQAELAEERVRQQVRASFPEAGEEQITTLFQGALTEELSRASASNEIATAFAKDLRASGASLPEVDTYSISQGLIARVSWHPRHVEARTGGDFGLVLIRPKLKRTLQGLIIEEGMPTGLLVQAKRKVAVRK